LTLKEGKQKLLIYVYIPEIGDNTGEISGCHNGRYKAEDGAEVHNASIIRAMSMRLHGTIFQKAVIFILAS
jgi:hypothetical protein